MHAKTFPLCALALAAMAGCSAAVTPGDAGVDAAITTDAGPIDTGMDAAPGDDAASTDAGPDDAMPIADCGHLGCSPPAVYVSGLIVFGDCMPIVAADPIHASWTTTVFGAVASPATLIDATLTIAASPPITQHLTVDAPDIAITGGGGSAMQTKTGADADPTTACGAACGSAAQLVVTFLVDGATVMASATGTYQCAF